MLSVPTHFGAALIVLVCCSGYTGSGSVVLATVSPEEQIILEEQLTHFEVLDTSDIAGHGGLRQRRYAETQRANSEGIVDVKFTSFGRRFHLYLTHDTSIFSSGFEAQSYNSSGSMHSIHGIFANEFFTGHVSGEAFSRVTARWENNLLIAKVETASETYYLEPLSWLLPQSDNHKMLAYRQSDLKHMPQVKLASRSRCGQTGTVGRFEDIYPIRNAKTNILTATSHHSINKRSPSARNTCGLLVIADYLFFRDVALGSETIAGNYMIDIVSRVDKIYRNTEFGENYMNMGFSIRKILIHTDWSDDFNHYNAQRHWTADELLNALGNYSSHRLQLNQYCLVHLFTANDRLSSVLGYASIADKATYSGICSQRTQPPENDADFMFNNTGFSTVFFGEGSRLLSSQTEVLLAHELGHNWGSTHDPMTPDCYPLVNGAYLMFEHSPHQPEPNNQHFSSCSKNEIIRALSSCADRCFEVARAAQRGNYRIDEGEECDAGVTGDRCCTSNFQLAFGQESCSDTNSECCKDCSAYTANNTVCRHSSQMHCLAEATCDGVSANCPVIYKDVGTKCFPSGLGRCTPRLHAAADQNDVYCAPLCEVIGLKSCLCREESSRCHQCCQNATGQVCRELHYSDYISLVRPCGTDGGKHCGLNWSVSFEPYEWTDVMKLPRDTPCFVGFCDSEGVCKKQTLDRIDRARPFFSGLTVDEAVRFMNDNVVGTVLILSLIIFLPLAILVSYKDSKMECKQTTYQGLGSEDDILMESNESIARYIPRYSTSRAYLPEPTNHSYSQKAYRPQVFRLLSHDQCINAACLVRQTTKEERQKLRDAA